MYIVHDALHELSKTVNQVCELKNVNVMWECWKLICLHSSPFKPGRRIPCMTVSDLALSGSQWSGRKTIKNIHARCCVWVMGFYSAPSPVTPITPIVPFTFPFRVLSPLCPPLAVVPHPPAIIKPFPGHPRILL